MADTAGKTDAPPSPKSAWGKLTWDDLNAWTNARSVERGRSYQRGGKVRDLAVSEDGKLLAWVQGTQRYATQVEMRSEADGEAKLRSHCTCPVGFDGCKHAVAVVLQYLEALKGKTPVPTAAAKDRRWGLIAHVAEEDEEQEDDEDLGDENEFYGEQADEYDEDEDEYEPAAPRGRRRPVAARLAAPVEQTDKTKGKQRGSLRAYLEGLPAAELVNLLMRFAEDYPDLGEELSERKAVASGKTGELLRQARKEMTRVTGERGHYDSWDGGGFVPDYSGLKRRLEQLLELGQADAVLDLGRELFERGSQQVQESQDEGETASELIGCLDVVFRAVARSSLPGPRKLLYTIELCLEDDYDFCQGADAVLEAEWSAADWSAVADELAGRLEAVPVPKGDSDFHDKYRRESLSGWLINALENAGRGDEALAILEAEAPKTGSYERLVRRLMDDGRLNDAARWAAEGIEHTRDRLPGIASHLRTVLREIAEQRKDWPAAAAFYAEDFFAYPSVESLRKLTKAAARAGCEEEVRAAALQFLETGVRPQPAPGDAPLRRGRPKAKPPTGPAWPLPAPLPATETSGPDAGKTRRGVRAAQTPEPHYDVLLDLAIAEKRPDDVLAWYDRIREAQRGRGFGWHGGYHDDRVADAVAATHPERALEMYRRLAEGEIAATSPSAYERAMPSLRKIRAMLHRTGREANWKKYVAELREENHRKRRFLEMLDGLEGRPIIEG
jgi:uncharacterized Zn finger protein